MSGVSELLYAFCGIVRRTSFSPTMICTTLPFGITCARSLSFTVCELAFSGCTLRFSSASGLNRPPARSLERSFFRRSTVVAMSASRVEKSKGSSLLASFPPLDDLLEAAFSSRAAFAPFFCRMCEVANGRLGGIALFRAVCWDCWHAHAAHTR